MASSAPGPSDDFWYEPAPASSGAGFRVTPDVALKASALFSCVKVLAESIGSLPLRVYRDLPDGGREPAPDDPIDQLIRNQPNTIQTSVEFWETQVLHAALSGTAYAEKIFDGRGALVELIPITTPVRVEQRRDRSLELRFWDPLQGRNRSLFGNEVFRVPGLSGDGVQGLRVVDLAADSIGLGLSQDVYASKVFSNGLNIGGFLVHPGVLSPEAQKNLIDQWMKFHSGAARSHRPAILQEGMKWEKAGQTADEAQLLDARRWQVGEIARFFRMPLHMLGIYDGSTRSNVEQQSLDLVKYTLRPWVRRIEQAIKRDLITTPDHSAKYAMEGLLRGDAASRAAFYHSGILDGWMLRNEARALENLNRIEGLDRPLVPSNMALVEEDGSATPLSTTGSIGPPGRESNQALAFGGSPSSEAIAALEPPLPSVPTTPAAAEPAALMDQRLDRFVRAAAERVVRKEIVAIRRREAIDLVWLEKFYAKHLTWVIDTIDLTEAAARVYCDYQQREVLAAVVSGRVPELLDRWEATRAAELSECILENAA